MRQFDLFGNEIPQLKKVDRTFLKNVVYDIFKNITFEDFISLMVNEIDECIEYFRLLNGEKSCQKTSLLFNPHRLDIKTKNCNKSIFSALNDDRFLDGLSRVIAFQYKDSNNSTRDLLYRALRFGINGVQYANEFPPYVARDLCLEFKVTENSKVLDPCAGWGGRMLGVSTICNNYECYEPSTRTYSGLLKLGDWIKKMNNGFNPIVNCLPFEDSNLENESYDFALTSPPYYDTEDYSDEQTNSKNRYKSFESWCDGFYLPMIQKTMNALKSNRYFVLNIGSRRYPLNDVLMYNFGEKYEITKHKNMLKGVGGGLRNLEKEGESFYVIKKS